MLAIIVAIIIGFLMLSVLGIWIAKVSIRYHWPWWVMLVVALALGGLLGNVYFNFVIVPLYQNIGN
ncbi:hypothetical protein pSALSNUABM04_122 [Salmonella phage pSal-SNUABM-04]|nr:hypothetical protein pSALSNUABM04_122 [Salmonella phage pSal-SNUABM-04]